MICVSNFIKSSLEKKLEIDKDKCVVLRNGIDTKKFSITIDEIEKQKIKKKYNINDDDKILLFTGRLVKEKGIKELLEALSKVQIKNLKLLVVGSSLNNINVKTKYEIEIEELVKKINKNVIFTGFVEYKEIYKLYAIADIAVLPSIWDDPAPLTIIESMAAGLPIITTNSGGIPEYAKNGCAVILKRDENMIYNLKNAIIDLLNHKEKRKKMSEISKENTETLTLNNYYFNFLKIIKE
ncbi:putative uncharacterized protein [Clostridium sp. CAG:273]|nr:putative uncharacterized protein [Clostridium sp. CAG:273]